MTTTPSGNPAWVRSNDHTSYGGDLNKRNWQGQGAVNAQTDNDAAGICRLAEDMSCCARTASFCIITWTCNDTSPAAPTISSAKLMTGVTTTYEGDNAPTGYPSAARNGDGDVTFTFSSSYLDSYGVSGALTIEHAVVSAGTASTLATSYVSGQTVRVRLIDRATGSGQDDAIGTLMIA